MIGSQEPQELADASDERGLVTCNLHDLRVLVQGTQDNSHKYCSAVCLYCPLYQLNVAATLQTCTDTQINIRDVLIMPDDGLSHLMLARIVLSSR